MNAKPRHPHETNIRQGQPLRMLLLATLLVMLVFAYFSTSTR